eukprot:g5331.t1
MQLLRRHAHILQETRTLTISTLKASETRLAAAKAARSQVVAASSTLEEHRASFQQDQEKVARSLKNYHDSKSALEKSGAHHKDAFGASTFVTEITDFVRTASDYVSNLSRATCHVRDGMECIRRTNERMKDDTRQKQVALDKMTKELSEISTLVVRDRNALIDSKTQLDAARTQARSLLADLQSANSDVAGLAQEVEKLKIEVEQFERTHAELADQKGHQEMMKKKVSAEQQQVSDAEREVSALHTEAQTLAARLAKSHDNLTHDTEMVRSLSDALRAENNRQDALAINLQEQQDLVQALHEFELLVMKESKLLKIAENLSSSTVAQKEQVYEHMQRIGMQAEDISGHQLRDNARIEILKAKVLHCLSGAFDQASNSYTALVEETAAGSSPVLAITDVPSSSINSLSDNDIELSRLVKQLRQLEDESVGIRSSCEVRRSKLVAKMEAKAKKLKKDKKNCELIFTEIQSLRRKAAARKQHLKEDGISKSPGVAPQGQDHSCSQSNDCHVDEMDQNGIRKSLFEQGISEKNDKVAGFKIPNAVLVQGGTGYALGGRRRRRRRSILRNTTKGTRRTDADTGTGAEKSLMSSSIGRKFKKKRKLPSEASSHSVFHQPAPPQELDPFDFSCAESEDDSYNSSVQSEGNTHGHRIVKIAMMKKRRIKSQVQQSLQEAPLKERPENTKFKKGRTRKKSKKKRRSKA